jgi:hypothetical protein
MGADVDFVVRRGLAKSNRARFDRITDFSDALRAVATGRVHDGQEPWTITSRPAAVMLSNPAGKGKSRQREWGMALIATTVASLSMSFVVGQDPNHTQPQHPALSAVPAATYQPRAATVGQEPRAPQVMLTAHMNDLRPTEVDEPAIVPLEVPLIVPLRVPLIAPSEGHRSTPENGRSSSAGRGRRHDPLDQMPAAVQPRNRSTSSPYPLDADATMPPDPDLSDPP